MKTLIITLLLFQLIGWTRIPKDPCRLFRSLHARQKCRENPPQGISIGTKVVLPDSAHLPDSSEVTDSAENSLLMNDSVGSGN